MSNPSHADNLVLSDCLKQRISRLGWWKSSSEGVDCQSLSCRPTTQNPNIRLTEAEPVQCPVFGSLLISEFRDATLPSLPGASDTNKADTNHCCHDMVNWSIRCLYASLSIDQQTEKSNRQSRRLLCPRVEKTHAVYWYSSRNPLLYLTNHKSATATAVQHSKVNMA